VQVVWFILVLVIDIVATEKQIQVRTLTWSDIYIIFLTWR